MNNLASIEANCILFLLFWIPHPASGHILVTTRDASSILPPSGLRSSARTGRELPEMAMRLVRHWMGYAFAVGQKVTFHDRAMAGYAGRIERLVSPEVARVRWKKPQVATFCVLLRDIRPLPLALVPSEGEEADR